MQMGCFLKKDLKKWIFTIIMIFLLLILFESIMISLPTEIRYVIVVLIFTVWLLLIELFPSTIVMLIALLLLFLTPKIEYSLVLSGFSSDGFMLIFFSLFLISILKETSIPVRIVYFVIRQADKSHFKLLSSILIISQIMSFIIPATAVRANILVEFIENITEYLDDIDEEYYVKKIYFLTLAIGLNISSVVVITASISNIITIEFLIIYTGEKISYLKWFVLMVPLWLSLICITWILMASLLNRKVPIGKKINKIETKKLSKLTTQEYLITGCIVFAIIFWMFQGSHELPLSFPLILVIVFLSIIKVIDWETINTIK